MTEHQLRSLIRQILESSSHDVGDKPKDKDAKKKNPKNLLTEPDTVKDRHAEQENEVSAGGVPGVAMPLGVGPHYPAPDSPAVMRIKKQIDVVGRAYGDAKPTKKRKK